MGLIIHDLIIVTFAICLTSVANAAQGTATYYTAPYVPSSSFEYQNHGVMIGAASNAIWAHRAACGRMYRVRCIGANNRGAPPCKGTSVVIKIVDYCQPGCGGTIDLSEQAFSAIAYLSAGRIKIEYTQV